MLHFGSLIAFLLLISLSLAQNSSSPDLVIELFRHGARAPLHTTYAPDWYDYQLGELTTIGMREHYLIGRALADQYPDILGQNYNLSKIYLRSSVLARSIDSAASQMYGVYEGHGPALNSNSSYPSSRAEPPFISSDIQQINQNLSNSQAIPGGYIPIAPNTTTDEGGVTLLEPTQVCFNLANNILENVLGDEAIQLWEDLAPTRQALQNAGLSVNNPYDLGTLGDALVCDYYDGRTLPGNIDPNSEVYLNVTFARNWYFTQALWGAEQQRQLLSVPLFNYIFKYFDAKAAGTTDFQFMFLSTAETNLIDLLATLNILTADCLMDNYKAQLAGQDVPHPNCNYTEFAASIILEFYNNSGSPTVIFKYNNVPMPVCSGQTECSYDEFKNLVNQSTNGYTPDDYKDDCLGRSLPELQAFLEKAGAAFEAKYNGDKTGLENILEDINEDGEGVIEDISEFVDNVGSDISEHIENIGSDISQGIENVGEDIENVIETIDNIGNN